MRSIEEIAMNSEFQFMVVDAKDLPHDVEQARALLAASQLDVDPHIGTWVLCRSGDRTVACAGLDHNVIKCAAVAQEFRGSSLSLRLGSEVVAVAAQQGYFHLFLYSMPHNRELFRGWGFYPIVEVPGLVVLMEDSPNAIRSYCDTLRREKQSGTRIGCAVLNANPFTLGHRYLVESAAAACDWVHVFVVREEASEFSYADRFALVRAGVADIRNVSIHEGSDYIISRATFPGYFLKETAMINHSWAAIDLLIFREYIAPALGITHRYVGTEPLDPVTSQYNREMKCWLEKAPSKSKPVAFVEVPRASANGTVISASAVRKLLLHGDFAGISKLAPKTTLEFLEKQHPAAAMLAGTGAVKQ
jgi:[citrate (pro-3S)-lyase] ligase